MARSVSAEDALGLWRAVRAHVDQHPPRLGAETECIEKFELYE
jgi:hypothetical protein